MNRLLVYAAVAAAIYAVLSFLASRSVYYPVKYPQGDWGVQRELGAEDAWITASDGARIHGWLVRARNSPLVTLFLHGNAGNLTHRYLHFRNIVAAGSSVLIIDYRGYGRSPGRPTEKGLYRDGDAAFEYLRRQGFRPADIVIHGESLGTAVAVDLAARRPCAGVILESALPSAKDVAATVVPVVGPWFIRGFDSRSKIGRMRAPLLFIHGNADDIIPIRLGRSLYETAPGTKSFWVVQGAGHNDLVERAGAEYMRRLRAFYDGLGAAPEL